MPNHGDGVEMARRLDRPQDQISRWASGAQRPNPMDRAMLEDELHIDWRAWDEPPIAATETKGDAA